MSTVPHTKTKAPKVPKPHAAAEGVASDTTGRLESTADDISVSLSSLKRLSFVKDAAVNASSAAEQVYKSARPYAPPFVEPLLTTVESKVSEYGKPVVASASDVGEKVLLRVDSQVDYVVKTVVSGKEHLLHSSLDDHIKLARDGAHKYLVFLHNLSSWLVEAVSPSKNLTRAKDTLHAALHAAGEATDPDKAIPKVQEAWKVFASYPTVAKILSTAEPVTKFGQDSFFKVHDTVVGNLYYKRVFELGGDTLSWATTTTPYKLTSKYLYPWVAPVADPAIEKLSSSKQLGPYLNYWKPVGIV